MERTTVTIVISTLLPSECQKSVTRIASAKLEKLQLFGSDKIPEILIPDAKGVAINPFGVNVRLDITKANKQKPEA